MNTKRIQPGRVIEARELLTIHDERVPIPDPRSIVHLQFRRFAGCPICSVHLRSIVVRYAELRASGITEVAVFHSPADVMREHYDALPFPTIADPERKLYVEFGVERSVRSLVNPRAWRGIARGIATFGIHPPARGESGLGLPADFLIAPDGRVLACKYGVHADDLWSVDEILEAAARSTGVGG